MDCEEAWKLMMKKADEGLNKAEWAALLRHMDQCPDCRELSWKLMDSLEFFETCEETVPENLTFKVMEDIHCFKIRKLKRRLLRISLSVAASSILMFLSMLRLLQTGIKPGQAETDILLSLGLSAMKLLGFLVILLANVPFLQKAFMCYLLLLLTGGIYYAYRKSKRGLAPYPERSR